jgi:hypothetical protein
MTRLWLALWASTLMAADGPRIFYSKSFPGSQPAYVEILLDKAGRCEYREAPQEDNPLVFQLLEPQTRDIFGLAEKLDYFKRPLESGLKVANMGMKTFRWDGEPKGGEAKFNYSQDENARLLLDWFERMTESEQHRINLERTVRFDKLGVNKVLLQLETSFDRKRLVGLDQFLPFLDRVAKNESFLHMARDRAATLADAFRSDRSKGE